MMNVIISSIDATAAEVHALASKTRPAGRDQVMVCISDTGVGLPPKDAFQDPCATKPDGVGMGLSIRRAVVKADRARVWAVEKVSHAADFRVALPTTAQTGVLGGEVGRVETAGSRL
jgi:signal transduction histidine kinase